MHFSGHNPPLLLLLPSSILPGSHRGAVVRRWPSAVDGTLKMNPRSNYVEERFGPSEYTCMQRYTCDIFSTFRSHTYTQTHRHTCEHTETVSVYGTLITELSPLVPGCKLQKKIPAVVFFSQVSD